MCGDNNQATKNPSTISPTIRLTPNTRLIFPDAKGRSSFRVLPVLLNVYNVVVEYTNGACHNAENNKGKGRGEETSYLVKMQGKEQRQENEQIFCPLLRPRGGGKGRLSLEVPVKWFSCHI